MVKLNPYVNQLKTALITLTRFSWLKLDDQDYDLKQSLWAFPLVGLLLGLVLSICGLLLQFANIPSLIGAVLLVIILCLITGALHEDGLADCADALGANTPEQRLKIMRDSQVGTYGSLALAFATFLKITAIYTLWQVDNLFYPLILSLMISRGAMVLLPLYSQPARKDGLATSLTNIKPIQWVVGQSSIVIIGLVAVGQQIIFPMICAALITYLVAKYCIKKIGGFTGDVLGAVEQLVQIMALLIFSSLL